MSILLMSRIVWLMTAPNAGVLASEKPVSWAKTEGQAGTAP